MPLRILIALVAAMTMSGACVRADEVVGKINLTFDASTSLRGDKTGKIQLIVWYPAAPGSTAAPDGLGPPNAPLFDAGMVANAAPFASGARNLPLIVLSHGTGGSAMQMAWLGTRLASRGYVAAAVSHPGNSSTSGYTPQGFSLWWLRASDLSAAITTILDDPRIGQHLDPNRIGAAGFSLGGYTVIELAGARTDLVRFHDYCTRTQWSSCDGPPEFPHATSEMAALAAHDPSLAAAPARGSASYRDARIKAVFAIAPALVPALTPSSLEEVTIPVSLAAGLGDDTVPVADNAIAAALLLPDASLHLFPRDVKHYTFLDDCTEAGVRAAPNACVNTPSRQRAVHDATAAMAGEFFGANL